MLRNGLAIDLRLVQFDGVVYVTLAHHSPQLHGNLRRQHHKVSSQVVNQFLVKFIVECFFCFELVDDCSVVVDAKVCNLGKIAVNQDVIRRDLSVIVQNKVIESNSSLEANKS